MRGLIIKDLLCLRKSVKILIIMGIFFVVMAATSAIELDAGFIGAYTSVVLVITLFSTFSFDDFCKWDSYATILPITRKQVVMSKYLMLLIFAAAGFVLSMLVYIPVALLNPEAAISTSDQLLASLSVMLVLIFIISVILPFIYTFGIEKSRLIFIVIGFAPMVIIYLLKTMEIPKPDENLILTLLKISPIFVIIGFFVSFFISFKIFASKDL